jgi:hypothetical protein
MSVTASMKREVRLQACIQCHNPEEVGTVISAADYVMRNMSEAGSDKADDISDILRTALPLLQSKCPYRHDTMRYH